MPQTLEHVHQTNPSQYQESVRPQHDNMGDFNTPLSLLDRSSK